MSNLTAFFVGIAMGAFMAFALMMLIVAISLVGR